MSRPRLLMLSHVPPAPRNAGQRQRVHYTLRSLRERFHVTLCLDAEAADVMGDAAPSDLWDELIALPPVPAAASTSGRVTRAVRERAGALATGLKTSNFRIDAAFDPRRLALHIDPMSYDVVFVHYWHASRALRLFADTSALRVLDMHDLLWMSRKRGLESRAGVPAFLAARVADRYRRREERAWRRYDVLVAINEVERDVVHDVLGEQADVLYVPMGVDLGDWPARWEPSAKARFGYYGGLSNRQRELEALRAVRGVMPLVWDEVPEAEIAVVGSSPTARIAKLDAVERVTVTGFVESPGAELASMTAVICPFAGRFGFRSRVIEVLATGTPLVCTADAIHGMGIGDGQGVVIADDDAGLAKACVDLARNPDRAHALSVEARRTAERFSYEATYQQLATELRNRTAARGGR